MAKILADYLSRLIEDGSKVLDVGAGPGKYSGSLRGRCDVTTIDAFEKVNPDILADLEKERIPDLVKNERFDYIIMLDFIEHVEKDIGHTIIEDCKSLCNKSIVLLTPLEEIWDDNSVNVNNPKLWCFGNEYDYHKSLWHVHDFREEDGWTQMPFKDYYFGYWTP